MTLSQIFHQAVNRITRKAWFPKPRWPQKLFQPSQAGPQTVTAFTTGLSQLDKAIEIRGLPQGRMTELIGSEGQGRIGVAAKIAAKFQVKQKPVLIIDMTGQFDPQLAAFCGLNAPELLIHLPQTAYELIHLIEKTSHEKTSQQAGLVIIDLGFVPQTFANARAGQLALLLRRLYRLTINSRNAFLYLTILEETDPFIHTNYAAGFQLNELADIRLWLQDGGWVKQGEMVDGYRGNITVIKNALGTPGKGANIKITFMEPSLAHLEKYFDF